MNNKIEAEKIEFLKLFKDFWFLVPEYQRSYVWEQDNVSDLLDDLWHAFKYKSSNEYFLGSLVLKNTENGELEDEYEVLDGQQRLTTLFIITAVIRDITKNGKLGKSFHKRIFTEEDEFDSIPERIRIIYKIRDDVEDFIKQFILHKGGTAEKEKLFSKINSGNISISNMSKAILFINDFFLEEERFEEIESFSKFLVKNVVFIYVATSNREDAFRLFTILNNRGIPLTNADILKSENIGEIDAKNQPKYARMWENIENRFGEDFDRFLSFIRTILVKEKARVNLLQEFEDNIYKRGKLKKGIDTVELINEYKNVYSSIIDFENKKLDNEYMNLVTIMQIGLPSEDWIPPLLLYYKKYETHKIKEFLEKLEYKFSGDWILGESPTKRIENMNNILKYIEVSNNPEDVINNEGIFDIKDSDLFGTLNLDVYGKRFARYILLKYEYLVSENTVHLSDYKNISVEHVLPQNPSKDSEWVKLFTPDKKEYWTNKLSNLVLISKKKNSRLGNLDFEEKKRKYLKSRIDIFQGSKVFIQTQDKWDVNLLENRQKEMLEKIILH
ncbi:hypothetical protein EO95_17150 [Methanosarcina sp. 1.H.T.1A.1]|nr:hypothetical protein EO95_17150 [Methanosarcina sp. 1.H.T.1A.1]